MRLALLLLVALGAARATADEIVLPAPPLTRDRPVTAVYRLDRPATGAGRLDVDWTDMLGRIVARDRVPVTLHDQSDVRFPLDLRRAVARGNRLRVALSFDGAEPRRSATARFVVAPTALGWRDYQVIMWQDHSATQDAALKALGVSAAMVQADRSGRHPDSVTRQIAPLLAADLPWYVENIATDFYSAYHRWSPGHAVNWRFLDAKARHRAQPDARAPFVRTPSLSDPLWLRRIRARLAATVAAQRAYRPLFYDLADEPGIGDLAAAWDFDVSAPSLRGLRLWLRRRYGSLAALNAQWGTRFARWDRVMPMTTDQALRRLRDAPDDNVSAWADFKDWMDEAFARAVRAGTDAVHGADPKALSGIEGAQIPGWGGYDYGRLVGAVDVMEPYDHGDNVEIIRSLRPELVMLTTSYASGAIEAHRVWRELLRGTRGILLWDAKGEWVGQDGSPGPRARAAAPYLDALRGGLGALLINSRRVTDPVAILYSPASARLRWLLDRHAEGAAWAGRGASTEYDDTTIRAATSAALRTLEHAGLQPRFVSSDGVEHGALERDGFRVLMLPDALALSDDEIAAIRRFTASGGVVAAAGRPARFDAHGRRRAAPPLDDLFAAGQAIDLGDPTPPATEVGPRLLALCRQRGLASPVTLTRDDGSAVEDVETYRFEQGGVTLIALLRDHADAAAPEPATLTLPRPGFVYDVRRGESLGHLDRLAVGLDAAAPTILAVSDTPLPAPAIALPPRVSAGTSAVLRIGAGTGPVFRVDVVDPRGQPAAAYSGNLLAAGGTATWTIPFARNDPGGSWTVRVIDRLSGQATTAAIALAPR